MTSCGKSETPTQNKATANPKGNDPAQSITIPDGVTRSGEFAFYYCECLTSTTIPDSVTKISYHAFDGCTNIQAAYNYAFIDELYKAINGNETTRSPAN